MHFIPIVRVSREGLRNDRLRSPEWQVTDLEEWAEKEGHTLAPPILEIDVSGGTTNRKALREARRAVLAGEADGLVAAYLSRFSRNTLEGLELVRDVLDASREFVALDCGLDLRTANGRKYLTDKFNDAQYEREVATEQFTRGRKMAIRRGVALVECFGYAKGDGGRLFLHPTEAEWVPRMFDWRKAGASYQQIADRLNDAGIRPHVYPDRRDGSASRREAATHWRHGSVKKVLENRTYLGEARSGEFVNPLAHDALVDLDTFRAVEEMRDMRPRRGAAEYELAGVLRCAVCGRKMKGNTNTARSGRVNRYYRCGDKDCKVPGKVRADDVEAFVQAGLTAVVAGVGGKGTESTVDLDATTKALRHAEAMRDQAADDIDLQAISRTAYNRAIAQWENRVDACREAVSDARAQVVGVRAEPADLTNWSSLPIDIRRRIIGETFDAVWVARDRTTFAASRRGEIADATARVVVPVL